ncbi:hypothetical protein FRACYDRAFT_180059 [Fragilariopsis cylindrus CCMP1102]|uniref:Integrase catalytic domain-containing protein n=1 Tax=Fragilariopsis cylindrus CCMP1102 TaxID=635003 RepID=A0A1E7FQF5_9STRA|nr:hypothetical protein FRACYDRAFT_180059 [Fragilariopsis cylindrus CCMP1102]|eukprot:OEU20400.1 hypothetical protein FRACYDRAFT_180059 [Fragilariopsis cylindrus CCMP1102]
MAKINHRFDQVDCHLPNTSKDNYVVSVNATKFFNEPLALMDGGANGGIGGRDMRLMSYNADGRRVNIGIAGDHQMTGKRLGTFCSVIVTNRGKILAIFHQYAHVPEQEKSIHSKCQFQAHNNLVGDTATAYGGPQRIQTADGYQLPLSIRSGLPYIRQTYPTNDEIKELTHVQFTSPAEWNPNLNDDSRRLDYYEQYDINATDIANVMNPLTPRYSVPTVIDYESKRKYFAHLPASVVKATFKHTTQNMKLPPASYLHKMFKSPNPSANLKRRDEDDATDMIYSDTPACNGGEKCAHIFVGRKSKLTDAYKVKHQNAEDFLLCFQDRVRQRGCPTGLVADNAPMYRGWKNAVYLRDICISLWQCESKYQHQNYAENRWQTVKRYTNRVMDRSGCPPYVWFLALSYVIFCLNNCVDPNIGEGNKSPLQIATFQMTDISPLLYFYFWEPVYYLVDESEQHFPSKSKEMRGRWVGISEHIGNKMTYKIISDTTGNEICRSAIRTARDNTMKNLREDPVTVDKDLFNVENILSPAEDIANNKLKEVTSGNTFNDFDESAISKDIEIQLQVELDARFNDSNEQQTGHFKTASPKRASPTGPQRHVKQKRLSVNVSSYLSSLD